MLAQKRRLSVDMNRALIISPYVGGERKGERGIKEIIVLVLKQYGCSPLLSTNFIKAILDNATHNVKVLIIKLKRQANVCSKHNDVSCLLEA